MPVALMRLNQDIWINNLLPLLTLSDIMSLIDAIPALEPVVDQWRPWGEIYQKRKRLETAPQLRFSEFFERLQTVYMCGYLYGGTAMSWLLERPSNNTSTYQRGPINFYIPSLQGILRSSYGIDIVKPLRLDYNEAYRVVKLGHGVVLCQDGRVFVKIPGSTIRPNPILTDCSPDGFYRSQWATHITTSTGKIWNFLPLDDVKTQKHIYFTFPFPNKPVSVVTQRHRVWCLVEGMGIVEIPHDYDGGPEYNVLVSELPEKMISMIGYYRRSLEHNPNEAQAEFDNTAIMLGESGRIYYYGPTKYRNPAGTNLLTPMDWQQKYPDISWDGEYCLFEIIAELQPSLQVSQKSKYPRIKSLCPWAYQYGIGIYPDDTTVMYLNVNNPPQDPPLAHKFSIETLGMNGIGYDGHIYRLPLSAGVWHQIPKVSNVVDLYSLQAYYQGVLLDSTMTMVRTSNGDLFQLGLIVGAVPLQQELHREIPASYLPNAPRLSQELSGAGINPRLREFLNPFAALPKPVNLPGRVLDVFNIYKQGMACCAIVKDDYI